MTYGAIDLSNIVCNFQGSELFYVENFYDCTFNGNQSDRDKHKEQFLWLVHLDCREWVVYFLLITQVAGYEGQQNNLKNKHDE